MLKLFRVESKRIELNVGIYYTNKFQNKQALVSIKHCQKWQIMVITEGFIAEFRILSDTMPNSSEYNHKGLKLLEVGEG